ncbi:MAG: LysR family transcriptional regulator [Planctomycetota bacterium]
MLNPIHLKTFLVVAKHLHFTKAADELYLSQPAVSRQMQQLRRDLGVALLEQVGKTLFLTDAGRTLAQEASRLLGSLERVSESIIEHRSVKDGRVRIGAGTTPGFYILPSILGRFHARFPGVELHYSVENSKSIVQKVLHNEVDLGFVGGLPDSIEIQAEPIAEDEIVCFASPAHPLFKQRRITMKLLENQTWVVRGRGSSTRELFETWFTKAGGEVGRMIELGCPEAVRSLVASGIGFGYLSQRAIADELARKRVKRIAMDGFRLQRSIYLVRHIDKYVSPAMKAFCDLVMASQFHRA